MIEKLVSLFNKSESRLPWNLWLGDRGERAASRFLRRQGLRVLCRSYKTSRGEIDLIARDGNTLVFIEVKTRTQGEPAEAVTPEKQVRIVATSKHFLKRYDLLNEPISCRYDIVAVVWPEGRGKPTIAHHRHAFDDNTRHQLI